MKKKTIYWFIGLSLLFLSICGFSVLFGVLIYRGAQGQSGLSFGDSIALIRVDGVIQAGEPPQDVFGGIPDGAYSDSLVRQLKNANENPDVKAVVIRINSPGGGVVASDEIYEQVAAMDKPVLISMGTMAASGGYYISAPADEIWANRHTLTGSIGVIIQFINIEGFAEEYGIAAQTIKSGANKDTGSLFRSMTAGEIVIWQDIIDDSYDVFVEIVAEGRGLDEATVREIADGRVYTGQQALELGLVDNLGNLKDVIDRAAELSGIEGEPYIIDYSESGPLFGGIFGSLNQPSPVEELKELLQLNTGPALMYLYTGN